MQYFYRLCIWFACLLLVFILSGCGSSNDNNYQEHNDNPRGEVPVGTQIKLGTRSYLLALPKDFQRERAYKLLLVFHGSGGDNVGMQQLAAFETLSGDYIVAYPQAEQVEWNEGCNCNIAHRLGVDDLGFVDQIIADIGQRYQLVPGEVYAAGFSQGALFSQNLACNRSEVFKAVAVVAAPMSTQLAASCAPSQPISIMMVMGKQDNVLPYNGYTHANFGLISAEMAIALFARLNKSPALPIRKSLAEGQVELTAYSNGKQKAELYAINQGGHAWRFRSFDTSSAILSFFAGLPEPTLPVGSTRVRVEQRAFHVRSMGQQHSGPAIILMAGPNSNYHSDSAWFALLQPLLAKHYRVHVIDRLGNGWSDSIDSPSYRRFAHDLAGVLQQLQEQQVVLVAFSSASISARLFYEDYANTFDIKAMLWIDPDIPLPHSLSLYKGYPVDWYQANLSALLPHLASGAWTERTLTKLQLEREWVQQLVAAQHQSLMDWSYFDLASQQRLLIAHQQARAKEIANYAADLDAYADLASVTAIPVSVIDTDFEKAEIAANPEQADSLLLWQQEGSEWSRLQAELSHGQYIALTDADHLLMLQQPEQIKLALEALLQQLQLP